jgi:2-hydroxy-6-oxonona-2,4-dienedioate hydrolase
LIHGAAPGASAQVNWGPAISGLAAGGFAVHAYDQPGFGYSAVPDDHSMEFRVAHAFEVIRALRFERFHLVAQSQGAYIAARVALEDPRVDRLVLVSSGTLAPAGSDESRDLAARHEQRLRAYEPSLEAMREMTLKTLHRSELVTEELVRERYEMSVGPRHEAMLQRQKAAGAVSLGERLAKIANPTLIVWGNNDHGVSLERGLLLFRALPDAEFHLFNHAAHWPQWDQADRFNRLVIGFLSA